MSRLIFDASTLGGTTTLSSEDAVGNFTIDVPAKTGTLLIPPTVGLAGQVLVSNATTAPTWQSLAGSGTVTSVSGTGTVNGLTLTGTVTSSGSLTLGGTLDLSSPPAIGGTAAAAGSFSTLNSSGATRLGGASGNQSLQVNNVASAVNYAQMVGAVAGDSPALSAQGTDANISFIITPKGTGGVRFTGPLLPNNLAGTSGQVLTSAGAGAVPTWTAPASAGPAFSAYISATQTVATNTYVKLAFNTKNFDTDTNYSTTNYRFTPTVAGYYQINGLIIPIGTGISCFIILYKNGSLFQYGNSPITAAGNINPYITLNTLVSCNGSTDYLELYVYTGGTSVTAGVTLSNFSGFLARSA